MLREETRPAIIVSTGRTGSKMLAMVLALHPATFALHEPKPFLNTENYLAWRGSIKPERLEQQIRMKRDWLVKAARYNGLLYIESSLFLSHFIGAFYQIYRPKVIYIFRDGRDFARSAIAKGWYRRMSIKKIVSRQLRRLTLKPFGNSFEDNRLSPPPTAKTPLEKIAWLWNEVNTDIQRQLDALPPEDVRRVRLETFDEEMLRDVLAFLRLETSSMVFQRMVAVYRQKPNRTHRFDLPPQEEWPPETYREFMSFAGQQMKILGYLQDD